MKKILLSTIALVFLANCAPKIKDFNNYIKQPILKSEFISEEKFKKDKPSVVVANFNNRDSELARKANLGSSMAVTVENFLGASKLVKLQDRKAFKNLEKEIALAEMQETGSYTGPISADYVVSGDVSIADYQYKFIAEKVSYNPKSGGIYRTPAKNKYTATFSGNLKIYELPSLKLSEVIPILGKKIRTEDAVVNKAWLFNSTIDTSTMKKSDLELVQKAGEVALKKNQHILKNIFSNLRKGYILEKRAKGNKVLFKISLGKDSAIKLGQKVKIFTIEENENPITGDVKEENVEVGVGVITDRISSKYAWILVKDKQVASRLKIGDFVTVIYKKSHLKNLLLTYTD